jgi:hypothetical protein
MFHTPRNSNITCHPATRAGAFLAQVVEEVMEKQYSESMHIVDEYLAVLYSLPRRINLQRTKSIQEDLQAKRYSVDISHYRKRKEK